MNFLMNNCSPVHVAGCHKRLSWDWVFRNLWITAHLSLSLAATRGSPETGSSGIYEYQLTCPCRWLPHEALLRLALQEFMNNCSPVHVTGCHKRLSWGWVFRNFFMNNCSPVPVAGCHKRLSWDWVFRNFFMNNCSPVPVAGYHKRLSWDRAFRNFFINNWLTCPCHWLLQEALLRLGLRKFMNNCSPVHGAGCYTRLLRPSGKLFTSNCLPVPVAGCHMRLSRQGLEEIPKTVRVDSVQDSIQQLLILTEQQGFSQPAAKVRWHRNYCTKGMVSWDFLLTFLLKNFTLHSVVRINP